jgi:WD40 repeat protein
VVDRIVPQPAKGLFGRIGFFGGIRCWDLATGKQLGTLGRYDGAVLSLAFEADGKTLTSGGQDGTVKLWDMTALPAPIDLIDLSDFAKP